MTEPIKKSDMVIAALGKGYAKVQYMVSFSTEAITRKLKKLFKGGKYEPQ